MQPPRAELCCHDEEPPCGPGNQRRGSPRDPVYEQLVRSGRGPATWQGTQCPSSVEPYSRTSGFSDVQHANDSMLLSRVTGLIVDRRNLVVGGVTARADFAKCINWRVREVRTELVAGTPLWTHSSRVPQGR